MSALSEPDAVLLIAHGSRQELANDEARELAERLNAGIGGNWVIACFLEIARLIFLRRSIRRSGGARKIKAVPFSWGQAPVEDDLLNSRRVRLAPRSVTIGSGAHSCSWTRSLIDEIVRRRIAGFGKRR
jgi:hypothetical protein